MRRREKPRGQAPGPIVAEDKESRSLAQPKDTELGAEKQPPKEYFGRIPDRLLPVIRELTHLEAHVFLVLCILANRSTTRGPLGEVCMTKTALAKECGIKRWPLYRAIDGLATKELVTPGDNGCHMVCHYLSHGVSLPVTPCDTVSTQPQQNTNTYEPLIGSEEVSEEVDVAAAPATPKKAPRKRVKPWLYWDAEEGELKARTDDPRCSAFTKKWAELLGNEERVYDQYEKANEWLKKFPKKRVNIKEFDQFFGNWLRKKV